MDIGALFLILAVILLVTLFVTRPFLGGNSTEQPVSLQAVEEKEHQRSTLLAEQDRLLNSLAELDFDHALGKIPEDEYPPQRANLIKEGVEVLRKLDSLQQDASAVEQAAEDRIEEAIAARRVLVATAVSAAGPLADDDLERMISARRNKRQEGAAGFCPRCGNPVVKSDKFCPRCGTTLQTN